MKKYDFIKNKSLNKSALLVVLSLFSYGCASEKTSNTGFMISNHQNNFDRFDIHNLDNSLLAGNLTIFDTTKDAFGHFSPSLTLSQQDTFHHGESFFDQSWLVAPNSNMERDGLGPHFNGQSCATCHINDGRGRPPRDGEQMESMLLRISIPGAGDHNQPLPSHIYGDQLQTFAIPNIKPEAQVSISYEDIKGQYTDGEKYNLKKPIYKIFNFNYGEPEKDLLVSPRVANQMSGMGLLEDIAESDILANADPNDRNRDGISGRPNYVWDVEKQKIAMGRFGWKANQPSIRQQVAGAFSGDIGITSTIFPEESYSDIELSKFTQKTNLSGGEPEINNANLSDVVVYSRNLAIPARRDANNPQVMRGERLFNQLSCNTCHTTTFKSQGQVIHPYTDLLLHDMGRDLEDNRPDFLANGKEWRTAPLWTIGLFQTVSGHTNYLHDGRADNITEAILWHGGEANRSRDEFKKLPKFQRDELIKFLNSL
ncbi:MAG: thiol oxidoreductase [Candidatus Sericytochromatia bacterium]|nr:thiol oxidoreductase [Candidatus Sericytochromatia bacterium]